MRLPDLTEFASLPEARRTIFGGETMLFLVTGDNIDPGYLLPPEQNFQILEQAVIPSFQTMAQWVKEGKAKGGVFPGERGGAAIIEAASFEELDAMMNQLPFFGLVKWQV